MATPHDTGGRPGGHPAAPPSATVENLRAELERTRAQLDRIRAAARTAAVVEQAKGVLTERLGCGTDAAYTHLLQLARDSGLAPEDAAALLLAPIRPSSYDDPAGGGPEPIGQAGVHHGAPPPRTPRPIPGTGDDLAVPLDDLQRLADVGWSLWEPDTGRIRWSAHVYVIFGRDPADGPLPLDRLAERVVHEDVPLACHLVRTLREGREQIDTEIRIMRGEEIRDLRLIGETVPGAPGRPVTVRCVYQDVTKWQRGKRALAASRLQLEERQREQAIELQRSILPLSAGVVTKPGLRAAVRYLPAGSMRVGGDWYETSAMDGDDGESVFLAIGDASGHGLTAAAAMARLRNGLSGLAFTGAPPDRLLYWLNRLALAWPITATVLAGRYDPGDRTLTWAQGGHFPPVLVRDGKAVTLPTPEGMLLGAVDDPEFGTRTVTLETGDLLLLYTDGLVERRERDLQEGMDLLVRVAADAGAGGDPERVLDEVLRAFDAPNPDDDTCVVAIRID